MEAIQPSAGTSAVALWSIYSPAPLGQRTLAALRPFICPLAPIVAPVPVGSRVFDIGCGNGLYLASLSRFRSIRQGVGVDVNTSAIESATLMATANGLPLTFSCARSFKEWPAATFDVVSMIDVMHHLPAASRSEFVAEALARVGDGGCFVYKDMCARPWWRRGWNAMHDLVFAHQLVRVEPLASVLRWAEEGGFAAVEQEAYVASVFYGHEFVVFRRGPSSGVST